MAILFGRFVLHELKPSVWNRGTSRKTRTARSVSTPASSKTGVSTYVVLLFNVCRRMRKNVSSVSISEDKVQSVDPPSKHPQSSKYVRRDIRGLY